MRRGEVPQKYIWEGKILNKISKKIISLVTMAAFVLTLVPAAAFAAQANVAIGNNIKLDASYLAVVNGKDEAQATKTVETGEVVTAKYFLNDSTGKAVANTNLADKGRAVVFWATEKETDGFDKAVSVLDVTESGTNVAAVAGSNAKRMAIATQYGTEVKFSFDRTGTYYLHAGVLKTYTYNSAASEAPKDADYTEDNIQELDVYSVVTVEKAAQVVDKVELTATDNVFPGPAASDTLQGNSDSTTVTLNRALLPNSIIEYTLTGVAKDSADGILAGETFNLTSNSDNLVLSKDTVTTAPDGSFNISFSLKKAGDYRITLHNSDVNYTINVVYDSTNADIKTVTSNGETLLAGNDTQNYVGDNRPANYAAAVEFEITDPDGGVVTGGNALANEPAARVAATNGLNHADYLKVDTKPDDSKLTASDLILVANNDSYTLQYVGDDAARDLIPGEYTVTVSLLNGEYATAKMTFAKYGTTQNVVLDMTAVPTNGNGDAVQSETITDQVKLGRTVTVQAKYVDENGVKINAQDVTYGFDGKAVDSTFVGTNQFQTRADQMFNESLLGTTINVTAFDSNKKEIASQKLTVVDAYTENSLAFDKTSGAVDTNNNVTVSVVDADGNVVPVTGNLDAYVADQSNVDADVTVKVAKDMTNGKDGKLILNSDKATTADIVVSVKAGNAQYYGTLNYTFGDVNGVGTSVVMTIGSSEYVINNELVTGDAAPYVADSRTMVPIRALTEAFGAKVDYDNDARTVTIVNNDTTIVMTVGETTYTVNGAEKTMDVAPVIGSGDRAYVPVRFVAEALGYTVTPLYAADGTTASVYFTM